jgi:hypothetical protein
MPVFRFGTCPRAPHRASPVALDDGACVDLVLDHRQFPRRSGKSTALFLRCVRVGQNGASACGTSDEPPKCAPVDTHQDVLTFHVYRCRHTFLQATTWSKARRRDQCRRSRYRVGRRGQNGVGHIERKVELLRIGPSSQGNRAFGEPLVCALYNTLLSAACRVIRCATFATTRSLEFSAYA